MTTSKIARRRKTRHSDKVGLRAFGSAGGWDVSIDETSAGRSRWFLHIEGPVVFLYFEVPSLGVVDELLHMLETGAVPVKQKSNGRNGKDRPLVLSKSRRSPVAIVRDAEYPDRFFLNVGQENSSMVKLTLGGADVQNVVEALQQVRAEL